MSNLSRVEKLRAKIAEEKKRKAEGGNGGGNFGNSNIYPFWLMPTGDEARVRILADANEDNPNLFFVDRLEHKISIGEKDKRIPCRKMYGQECPICNLSSKYYKDEGKGSKNGKYYYRSKQSLVRLLVLKDPLDADQTTGETREGKTLNSQFGYQLMEKIKEQIGSDDLGDFTSLDEGFDFVIKKTPQGEYGTYSVGSGFARRPSAVPDDLRDSVELVDLSTLLPADLGYEKVQAMLEAHLNGEDYVDDDAPPARTSRVAEESKPTAKPAAKPSVREEEEEEEVPARRQTTKPVVQEADVDDEDEDEAELMRKLLARRRASASK